MPEIIETEIGFIPKHWTIVTFDKALKVKGRVGWKGYKTSDLRNEGPVVVGGTNIKANLYLDFSQTTYLSREKFEESPEIMLQRGDVILVTRGNGIGDVGYYDGQFPEATINPSLVILSQFIGNPKYLFYYLNSPQGRFQVLSIEGGTSIPALYQGYINTLLCPIPPIKEQEFMVEILSSIDEKINLLHRQNQTLEHLAGTFFKRKLTTNAAKWEMKPLGEFIETTLGGEWGKEKPENEFTFQVCCIRGTDIADLQTGLADRTPIRFVKEKKFESITPNEGDIILEISGGTDDQSTGRAVYINESNRTLFPYPLIFSNFCRLIKVKKREFSYFLHLYLQYLYQQDEFFNLENGSSGIKNLDYKYLLFELNFLLPSNEQELIEFNKEVKLLFEKINNNKHQIRTLIKLRDTLLPKLMSGEVRVEN